MCRTHSVSFVTGATLTDLGRVDADEDGGSVGLLPLDALDVHAELLPVALHNLADLLALVVAADHLHLVVLLDALDEHAELLPVALHRLADRKGEF